MRFPLLYISALCLVGFVSCFNSEKTPTSSDTEKQMEAVIDLNYFIVGQGGGVTGEYQQYRVQNSGEVKKLNFKLKTYEAQSNLSENDANKLFSQLKKLELNNIDIDAPGNMNYYLEIPDASGSKRLLWSDENPAPEKVLEFYTKSWSRLTSPK